MRPQSAKALQTIWLEGNTMEGLQGRTDGGLNQVTLKYLPLASSSEPVTTQPHCWGPLVLGRSSCK